MTAFFRLVGTPAADKAAELHEAVKSEQSELRFAWAPSDFSKVPGSPFCYWVSDEVRQLFNESRFEGNGRFASVGASTKDNFRYTRLWFEISGSDVGFSRQCTKQKAWVPYSLGGRTAPFYRDVNLVLNWKEDGRELKAAISDYRGSRGWGYQWSAALNGHDFYFSAGLTWPLRAARFSPQAMPAGGIFSGRGYAAFVPPGLQLATLAIFNSSVFDYLFKVALGRFGHPEFLVGVLHKIPFVEPKNEQASQLSLLGRNAWSLKRELDTVEETSHAFLLPAALRPRHGSFDPSAIGAELARIRSAIDEIVSDLYGLSDTDRAAIMGCVTLVADDGGEAKTALDENSELEDEDEGGPDVDQAYSLLSWAVGVAMGRFDWHLAFRERDAPPEPGPFDHLPAKSPGMLSDGDMPFMPSSGVFVDDPGHADDLAARVTAIYERVGETPPAPDALRKTLAKDFFPAHIRMYSKSRRKAPIYWQLATPSASYSVWLYIHAFGKDTLFRVQNDYVAPKLTHERRELEGLLAEAGPSPTTGQNRAVEAQSNFVEELSALLDEVKRVAPLWDPDLDDGVILNCAPLWRLVPQNRAWQKELRAAWAALVDGDYDWAHLSMRLWPERVVPKCAKDRSLAIAHGLEDVFWFEDAAGKWQARPAPTRPLDELIAKRTSPAVKAALQSLLDAPDPVAASGRGRRKKS
ncbi:hypothetical protein [uncultured Brevundimonas sp.]|uniref:hypothetical protein n=1 Tax=uncultured Brevundimonas sp. TaxID=213418 RepID=UPI0025DDC287|nr:hypothetical protein [uncultured Brevundimonas sp.]